MTTAAAAATAARVAAAPAEPAANATMPRGEAPTGYVRANRSVDALAR